jgi:phosphatidylglycerol:prolipoprotein diacylglycerol transferase
MPSIIRLGPLNIHLYGLILGFGFVAALQVINQVNKQANVLSEKKLNALVWIAIAGGIIGARLYHVIDAWEYYRVHVALIPQVWRGGLGIYGGMIGGVVALLIGAVFLQSPHTSKASSAKTLRFETLKTWFDLAALGLPLGQAIGRFGNWINQELYGLPTALPWGIYIEPQNRLTGFEDNAHFHPLFAYEAVWMLLTFILLNGFLYRVKKMRLGTGVYAIGYLASYASIRFGLDYLRIDPWRIGIFTVAQWLSIALLLVALLAVIKVKARVLR